MNAIAKNDPNTNCWGNEFSYVCISALEDALYRYLEYKGDYRCFKTAFTGNDLEKHFDEVQIVVTDDFRRFSGYISELKVIFHDELRVRDIAHLTTQAVIYLDQKCLVALLSLMLGEFCHTIGYSHLSFNLIKHLLNETSSSEAIPRRKNYEVESQYYLRKQFIHFSRALIFGHEIGHYIANLDKLLNRNIQTETISEELFSDIIGLKLSKVFHKYYAELTGVDGDEPIIDEGIYEAINNEQIILVFELGTAYLRNVLRNILKGNSDFSEIKSDFTTRLQNSVDEMIYSAKKERHEIPEKLTHDTIKKNCEKVIWDVGEILINWKSEIKEASFEARIHKHRVTRLRFYAIENFWMKELSNMGYSSYDKLILPNSMAKPSNYYDPRELRPLPPIPYH